jgi:hypothetical protein
MNTGQEEAAGEVGARLQIYIKFKKSISFFKEHKNLKRDSAFYFLYVF